MENNMLAANIKPIEFSNYSSIKGGIGLAILQYKKAISELERALELIETAQTRPELAEDAPMTETPTEILAIGGKDQDLLTLAIDSFGYFVGEATRIADVAKSHACRSAAKWKAIGEARKAKNGVA